MKGILYQYENDFFIEYEGEWQESTLLLMEAVGDNPDDFRCIKEIPVHPDDVVFFNNYPECFDNIENTEIEFNIVTYNDKEVGNINFYYH